jgi:hypothetical protein
MRPGPALVGRHTPTSPVVIGPTSARRTPVTVLGVITRSEYLWSPIFPSRIFANPRVAPSTSDREATP